MCNPMAKSNHLKLLETGKSERGGAAWRLRTGCGGLVTGDMRHASHDNGADIG
jgi:hypothetical protein